MIVLIVLFAAFTTSLAIQRIISGDWQMIESGNIAMFVMLLFTAFGHFKFSKGMEKMLPKFSPMKKEIIFITGIFEILCGIALLFPDRRYTSGILLILFFILILPANIKAAIDRLDYQKGTYDGNSTNYLWFRVPMQIFLILWVWYFSVRGY
ncbi:Uncharacterized membrane protein [Dyadobacter koreensis]|uniref:Uncharacterized membrane protein n=1 Tax=Dyadobacter koreensis TaxID=408657 RepID=A0A1H6USW7_9BACT|nr:hypothetical protein [Dyadobacter koreensis]SEI95321.1 Uncharacterized membrane protein [Dyadobacter koreensis]